MSKRTKYRPPNGAIRLDVAQWPGAVWTFPPSELTAFMDWLQNTPKPVRIGWYDLLEIDGEPYTRGDYGLFRPSWCEGMVLTVQEVIRDPREEWLTKMVVKVGSPLLRFRMRREKPPNQYTWVADPVKDEPKKKVTLF